MRPLSRHVLHLTLALTAGGALGLGVTSALAAPGKPSNERTKQPDPSTLLSGFDPRERSQEGGSNAPLREGRKAVLTVVPELESHIHDVLERYQVPAAGLVALDPRTGRVLAYVSHDQGEQAHSTDHARDASAPAASVFKLITGSALLEHGVRPTTHTCYHGGYSALRASELSDNPKLDTACVSFTTALSRSVNAVFGKLALKHLKPALMTRYASAFGFGERPPFDVPTPVSRFDVPTERVERARAAAGFWHSSMSPLHGALIAATLANGGEMMRPFIVDHIKEASGEVSYRSQVRKHRSVIGRYTAQHLGRMMQETVTRGTARKSFFDRQGNAFLPGIRVAGKTGTLSRERPYRGYTWWIGFAPADAPRIALAALVINDPKWRIKAPYVAREALRYYLIQGPQERKAKQRMAAR